MTNYENLPDDLKRMRRWVCAREGSKVPMQAEITLAASSTNRGTWASFSTALKSVEEGIYDYLGFVFAEGDGLVGIDIDDAFDEDRWITPMAADIINTCRSYTEISKSGTGFHILLRGNLPFKGKNNLHGVEIYKTARYFILTGNTYFYSNIAENQAAIDEIVRRYFPEMRDDAERTGSGNRIYSPVWENAENAGRIRLRPVYPRIPDGSRNICLTSLAGMLHSQGYSKAQIYDELLYANTVACDPPLHSSEIRSICNSVMRYKR